MGMAKTTIKKKNHGSIRSIFMHADFKDWFLMALGLLGSIGDGFTTPLVLLICSRLMNNIGGASPARIDVNSFLTNINKVFLSLSSFNFCLSNHILIIYYFLFLLHIQNAVALLYIACGSFLACFLGEFITSPPFVPKSTEFIGKSFCVTLMIYNNTQRVIAGRGRERDKRRECERGT